MSKCMMYKIFVKHKKKTINPYKTQRKEFHCAKSKAVPNFMRVLILIRKEKTDNLKSNKRNCEQIK